MTVHRKSPLGVGEFVRERYRKFCALSVHRSLWTIVIHLFIINNIEINNHVEKYSICFD